MSIEDAVEDVGRRLSKIEDCLEFSDNFDELKVCMKPLSREETRKAIAIASHRSGSLKPQVGDIGSGKTGKLQMETRSERQAREKRERMKKAKIKISGEGKDMKITRVR